MSEQVLDLSRIARAIWLSRIRLILVVAFAGLAGFCFSFLKPGEFTANSVLFIQDIRIGAMTVSQEERRTTPETFLHFLTNDFTLDKVIEECHLGSPPQHFKINSLRRRVNARVGGNASTIELSVTMPSPELALRVARSLIGQATRFSEELIRQDVATSQRLIREQVEELSQDLRQKSILWQEVLERSRLESDLQRINQMEMALRNLVDDLNQTTATVREKRAQYESLLADLRVESATMVVRQSIVESPAFTEVGRELLRDRAAPSSLLGLQLHNEIENPVYQELRVAIAEATAEYEGGRARAEELQRRIDALHREIDQNQARYSRNYPQAMRLEKEFDAAQLALRDVVQTHAQAASEVFWERQRLRVVPPVLPDAPSGPDRMLSVLAAALIGGCLALVIIVARVPRGELVKTTG